ncbi:YcjF family protein [Nitrospirillum iridis]|uniref:Uncharacterized protein (DUF697 family) n=1 Tax=Nitrospirillum iridis TaxID=765888 RepID=A0A7X0B5R7_9PROT|nr:DUF697 domain-containing protein [Nitrospirillum iridis]MBB6254961.1 uncharacterized protein (DUF697 family) [Nitrospirillum iridis]
MSQQEKEQLPPEGASADAPVAVPPDVLALRLDKASRILARYSGWGIAAGAVPVPVVDLAALAVVQTKMVMELAELYGETVSLESVQALVGVLIGVLVPKSASSLLTQLLVNVLPGVAGLVGLTSMAAFSGVGTYAMGRVFIRYFEGGGRLHGISARAIRRELEREFATRR